MKLTKRLKLLEEKHAAMTSERDALRSRCTEFASLMSDIVSLEEADAEEGGRAKSDEQQQGTSDDVPSESSASDNLKGTTSPETETLADETPDCDDARRRASRSRRDFTQFTVEDVRAAWGRAREKARRHRTKGAASSRQIASSTINGNTTPSVASDNTDAATESLRHSLDEALAANRALTRELSTAKAATSDALAQAHSKHEEAMLFLKLKLDSAKRQAEKDAAVHAQLLKAHLEEMSTRSASTKQSVLRFRLSGPHW